jgi:hypothetical protein
MKSSIVVAALAVTGALGFANTADAQVYVNTYPGGLGVSIGNGYGYSPGWYGYSYPSYYSWYSRPYYGGYWGGYSRPYYSGYRGGWGWGRYGRGWR